MSEFSVPVRACFAFTDSPPVSSSRNPTACHCGPRPKGAGAVSSTRRMIHAILSEVASHAFTLDENGRLAPPVADVKHSATQTDTPGYALSLAPPEVSIVGNRIEHVPASLPVASFSAAAAAAARFLAPSAMPLDFSHPTMPSISS